MDYEKMAVTVSDLNLYIKNKFEQDEALNTVAVKGEISNFKNHYTGHLYFTLKDDKSLIKCIMFKSYATRINFNPKDGDKVIVFGQVSVFERDGVYQIYVKAMEQSGIGDLYVAYEKLKKQLEEEGLFNEAHKKKIPLKPKVIGVLTSKTGSVIRDIINVSTRRNPNTYIRLFPVPVQGKFAAEEIAYGINVMNKKKLADVLILARGGGSLEDLWPFNEEIVARAIYDSEIPIISAVGHETDFTIADFVADLRAPTPSAAAELANPDIFELKQKVNSYKNGLRVNLKKQIDLSRLRYQKVMASRVFTDPLRIVNDEYLKLDKLIKTLEVNIKQKQNIETQKLIKIATSLDKLSPLKIIARGYTIVENEGKIVKKSTDLKSEDILSLRFTDGTVKAKVL